MATVKDAVNNVKVLTISLAGPASYATGGFLVDATANFSWLGFMRPTVSVISTLPNVEYEILLNVDLTGAEAFGKGVIKLVKQQYSKGSSGAVSGQPGGVTVQSSLTANTTSNHTHTFDHNHGTVTSSTETQAGAGSNAGASPDALAHTHVFTIANFTGTTPSGGAHTHNRPFEYDHNHAITTTATDVSLVEVTATTNLSGVTFNVICFGWGKI